MVYQISCFLLDQSVSLVSEKWVNKNGRKCWFPKTNVALKIKRETPVDKKSGEWTLLACRLLMHGARYATLKEAKEAEKIAQNHSTMTSFESSYVAKREARKYPKVYNDSLATKSGTADSEIIDQLKKSDKEFIPPKDKKYMYNGNVDLNNSFDTSVEDNGDVDGSNDGDIANCSDNEVDGSDDGVAGSDDGVDGSDDGVDGTDNEVDTDGSNDGEFGSENSDEAMDRSNDVDDMSDAEDGESVYGSNVEFSVSGSQLQEQSFFPNYGNNFESTNEVLSPATNYDFSDDRCLQRIEKLIKHACQELESIKREIKALNIKSTETEEVVGHLVAVCKDLTVEVFTCTAELKKRNGMFTDLLVPDLKLNLKRRKHHNQNELALANTKIVDNLIKYLASTINESKENKFIEGCFNAIFDREFLTDKVWWKSEPGKVLIKKSRTLHCIKESFKLKFGLVEPKRCDKTIEALIHKTCRNMKDNFRKALKKSKEADEKAATMAKTECVKNSTKKTAKKEVETKSTDMATTEADIEAEGGNDWDLDDYENYKKNKKAKRAAKKPEKLKFVAEESDRAKKNPDRQEEKNLEEFDVGVKSSKHDWDLAKKECVKNSTKKTAKKTVKKEVETKSTDMATTEGNIEAEGGNDWDLDDYENYKKHKKAKRAAKRAAKKAEKLKFVAEESDRAKKNSDRQEEKNLEEFDVGGKSSKHGRKRSAEDDFNNSDGAIKRKKGELKKFECRNQIVS